MSCKNAPESETATRSGKKSDAPYFALEWLAMQSNSFYVPAAWGQGGAEEQHPPMHQLSCRLTHLSHGDHIEEHEPRRETSQAWMGTLQQRSGISTAMDCTAALA